MFGRPIGKCKRLAKYARPASLSARGVVYCGNDYARYARATRCTSICTGFGWVVFDTLYIVLIFFIFDINLFCSMNITR